MGLPHSVAPIQGGPGLSQITYNANISCSNYRETTYPGTTDYRGTTKFAWLTTKSHLLRRT